jgi:predicted DNA-binding transcriptional regulator AlpA
MMIDDDNNNVIAELRAELAQLREMVSSRRTTVLTGKLNATKIANAIKALMAVVRAAAYIDFGRTKFLEMVNDGRMPKPVYIDGNPRWDRVDLDSAVEDLKEGRARIR